jgi:sugar phosphate isomerase/epimerase
MKAFISSGAFHQRTLPEVLSEAKTNNIDRVELSPGLRFDPDALTIAKAASKDFTFLVHNYFPPPKEPFTVNLAARDADLERKSIELSETAIDFCGELKIPFFSVHAGFAFDVPPEALGSPIAQAKLPDSAYEDIGRALERFRKNVLRLAARAKGHGIRILFENNCVVPEYFDLARRNPLLLSDPNEIVTFFNELNEPTAGLLCDVAHAEVTCHALGLNKDDFVQKILPHIGAWHLSCTDGVNDNNQPVTEDAWFWKHVQKKPECAAVVEVYKIAPETMFSQLQLVGRMLD